MPSTVTPRTVRLEFEPGSAVHTNLSGAASAADGWLWVAGDEACAVDRLQRLPPTGAEALRFGNGRAFPLHELLDLPGGADEEADIEGLAVHGGWLWLVGSHGLKRKSPKPGRDDAENAKRLAKLSLDPNRLLLARIPIETPAEGCEGAPVLVRAARDGRRAARLDGDARRNALTDLLAEDPHLAPFLAIPGKDNGLDIEGLAVAGDHVFLGLRGPVLRGWSTVLQLSLREQGRNGHLKLAPLDDGGLLLRKHFLSMEGLGVRDLHVQGQDLHILAGPTMVLDGDARLFRWEGGLAALAGSRGPACFHPALQTSVHLPHGRGCDRAEAVCTLPASDGVADGTWLVLYDAPGPARREGDHTVFGDLLPAPA